MGIQKLVLCKKLPYTGKCQIATDKNNDKEPKSPAPDFRDNE